MDAFTFYEMELGLETCAFYRRVMEALIHHRVPFLIGGTLGLGHHTGIVRHTKDMDLFLRPAHCRPALRALASEGFETELRDVVWLAKVYREGDFVDLIFRSGNAIAEVDDEWFCYASKDNILGVDVLVSPVEETIWSKAFTMEKERYDGADIAHLILKRGRTMDWHRLIRRFEGHWPVLLSHLVLFGYVYPTKKDIVPTWVLKALVNKLQLPEHATLGEEMPLCRGPFLSRVQYMVDTDAWDFRDGRLDQTDKLTPAEIEQWKRNIEQDKINAAY